jgi:Transposase domain (DUF772)
MMGRLNHEQEQFFYSFRLDEAVPEDHPVREIAAVVDLSWVHSELAAYYPKLGRPSIDPVLMIRMLIVGYVFAIRSERALCRDVQVNLAYRWFCGLSIEDRVPDHSAFSRARNERFRGSFTKIDGGHPGCLRVHSPHVKLVLSLPAISNASSETSIDLLFASRRRLDYIAANSITLC